MTLCGIDTLSWARLGARARALGVETMICFRVCTNTRSTYIVHIIGL